MACTGETTISSCAGTCAGECQSCEGTCVGNCSLTCFGSCQLTCTGNCAGSCIGCTGTCNTTCFGSCKTTCTTTCTQTCNNFCNAGCSSSAMAFTITEKLNATNMQTLADLVFFEVSRRPNLSMDSVSNLFSSGNKIYSSNFTKILGALANMERDITSPSQGSKALKSFVEEIVANLLAANAENVPID